MVGRKYAPCILYLLVIFTPSRTQLAEMRSFYNFAINNILDMLDPNPPPWSSNQNQLSSSSTNAYTQLNSNANNHPHNHQNNDSHPSVLPAPASPQDQCEQERMMECHNMSCPPPCITTRNKCHSVNISGQRTYHRSGSSHMTVPTDRPPSYLLLMVITFWASAIIHGPLSSVKGLACLPSGNNRFMVGTILCNVMILFTCFVGAKITPKDKVPLVVAVTALGTILLTYFVALIWFSHTSQTRDDSPIFGPTGELLAVSI